MMGREVGFRGEGWQLWLNTSKFQVDILHFVISLDAAIIAFDTRRGGEK